MLRTALRNVLRAQGPAADDRARRHARRGLRLRHPGLHRHHLRRLPEAAPRRASTSVDVAVTAGRRRRRRRPRRHGRAARPATARPGAAALPGATSATGVVSGFAALADKDGKLSATAWPPRHQLLRRPGRQGPPLPDDRGPRAHRPRARSPSTPRPPSAPATGSATPSGCRVDGPVRTEKRHRHLHHRRRQRRRRRHPHPLRHRHRPELFAEPGQYNEIDAAAAAGHPPGRAAGSRPTRLLPARAPRPPPAQKLADEQAEQIAANMSGMTRRPAGLRRHRAVRRHLPHRQHLHHAGRPAHQGAGAAARGRRHAAAR